MFRTHPVPAPPVGVPVEGAQPNPLIGWGFLALAGFTTYTAAAWSSPIPRWVPPLALVIALAWPGAHSPRAAARACVRACTRTHAGADVGVQVPARRVPARVWVWGAGGCVTALALVWAAVSLPPLALAGLVLVLAGGATWPLLRIFSRPGGAAAMTLLDVSSGGGAEGLALWQADTLDRWYDGVRQVPGLTLREDPDDVDEGMARRLIAHAEIVDEDVRAVPGGVAFAVDTRAAEKITEDVQESVPKLRRVLDAEVVLVEPVPARASFCVVTAYRGEPFHKRPAVDWRGLRKVDGAGEVVPVGETAHADLLRQDAPPPKRGPRPVLSGRQALMSYRGSTLIVSAPDMGKSALVRAYLLGLLIQEVPFLPVLLDNKGDYWALRDATRAMGGIYTNDYAEFTAALDWADQIGESRYLSMGERYQHRATLQEPMVLPVIAEWVDFVEWARASKSTALSTASRMPRRHRGSGVNLITTAQGGQQELLTKAREFFPHRVVLRVDNDAHVDMVLGDGALRRGAHAHLIPHEAQGVFWAKDRRTGSPYMGRAAWIPEADQGAALVEPMIELGRRMAAAKEAA